MRHMQNGPRPRQSIAGAGPHLWVAAAFINGLAVCSQDINRQIYVRRQRKFRIANNGLRIKFRRNSMMSFLGEFVQLNIPLRQRNVELANERAPYRNHWGSVFLTTKPASALFPLAGYLDSKGETMPIPKLKYVETADTVIDNDSWNHSIPKLPRASPISLGDIKDVLPFDGVRNPSSRSNTSQKVVLTYRTAANDWKPKIGIAESAAEAAAGLEAVMSPSIYDVAFQPSTVQFCDEDGVKRSYTHDLLITFQNGHRRMIFVRNEASLQKPRTQRQINAIVAATPRGAADDMIVVNANDYSRQRRDNLMRMHHFVFHPDAEADEVLLETARSLNSFYFMKDLFPHTPVSMPRAFAACYRLIARGDLCANLDHVLWENSRIEVAA
jgi:hypothetical protein